MKTIRLSFFLLGVFLLHSLPLEVERVQAVHKEALLEAIQPLPIIQNHGQSPADIRYHTVGGPFNLGFADDAIWIALTDRLSTPGKVNLETHNPGLTDPTLVNSVQSIGVRLTFEDANPHPHIEPIDPLPTTISLFHGHDPERWVSSAPVWGGIRYVDLFPGLDLELTANHTGWQFRWTAQNGYQDIRPRLVLSGGRIKNRTVERANGGQISLQTDLGIINLMLPTTNIPIELHDQPTDGKDQPGILLLEGHPPESQVNKTPAKKNPASELVYGTYLGGSLWDEANDIAIDPAGNLYLAGHTLSPDFPAAFGLGSQRHNVDAFVARINAATGMLGYLALFQGDDLQNGEEWARSIAVDSLGNAYVAGRTNSPAFPVTPGAFDTSINGDWDIFALKLNPSGALDYATFIGGEQLDWGTDLAIDDAGMASITGGTFSSDFPISPGAYDSTLNGSRDIFLARLNADGTDLAYSTFIGGAGQEQGESLALTGTGDIYVTGWTNSTDFPTTAGAYAEGSNGNFDAFVVKLSFSNPELLYATYVGGAGEDRAQGVTVDPFSDSALVVGRTNSDDFPVTSDAYSTVLGPGTCDFSPCPDAFLVSLPSTGTSLTYATFVGGAGWDEARDLAVNGAGEIFLSGETHSLDFPTTDESFDESLDGDQDGFITVLTQPAYSLIYSSYLGGGGWDTVNGIKDDDLGGLILTGRTLSTDFPTTPDALSADPSGDYDVFAVRMAFLKPPNLYLPILLRFGP